MNGSLSITRSFMTLCFVAAALLLLAEWLQGSKSPSQVEAQPVVPEIPVQPQASSPLPSPQASPTREGFWDAIFSKGSNASASNTASLPSPSSETQVSPGAAPQSPSKIAVGSVAQPSSYAVMMSPILQSLVNRPAVVIDLSDRQVSVYRGGIFRNRYDISVGKAGWETPTGTFEINDMQVDPYWKHPITGRDVGPGPDNPLGSRWIGFWTDGENAIGFHGTRENNLIGQAVSHGCVRMRNADIEALFEQVALGTPVVVQQ